MSHGGLVNHPIICSDSSGVRRCMLGVFDSLAHHAPLNRRHHRGRLLAILRSASTKRVDDRQAVELLSMLKVLAQQGTTASSLGAGHDE